MARAHARRRGRSSGASCRPGRDRLPARADAGRRRRDRPLRAARRSAPRASARARRSSPAPATLAAEAEAVLVARDPDSGASRPLTDGRAGGVRAGSSSSVSLEHLFSPARDRPGRAREPDRLDRPPDDPRPRAPPTDEFVAYHEARARGGTGLIVLEATAVHPSGLLTAHTLAGYREEIVPGYERVARRRPAVRDAALRPALPRRARADRVRAAPAGGRAVGDPEPALQGRAARPRDEEIESIVAGYARAAGLAAKAGLDGVEISAAHGYLIAQFLTPELNRRSDEWADPPAFLLAVLTGGARSGRGRSPSASGSRPTRKPLGRSSRSWRTGSTTCTSRWATRPPTSARRASSPRRRRSRTRSPSGPSPSAAARRSSRRRASWIPRRRTG